MIVSFPHNFTRGENTLFVNFLKKGSVMKAHTPHKAWGLFSSACMSGAFFEKELTSCILWHVRKCGWNDHFPTHPLPVLNITVPHLAHQKTGVTSKPHSPSWAHNPILWSIIRIWEKILKLEKQNSYPVSFLYLQDSLYNLQTDKHFFQNNKRDNWFWIIWIYGSAKFCHDFCYDSIPS